MGEINRGKSKHRPRNDARLFGGKYPFIQTGDVKIANLYINEYDTTYSEFGLAQSKLWPKDTLCITIAANIAESAILGIDACFPDSVVGFVPKKNKADLKFVKYLLDEFKVYMQQISKGTTQDNLSLDKLRRVKFYAPDYDTQVKIAKVISVYDDLIENNNRRIKILEKMAENLYKEWFVRFRFPGYEQAEFENGIPKGWKACKLREIIRIRYGKEHKDLEDGTIPVFGSGGVMRYGNRALYSGETVMIPRKGSLHNVTYYKGDLWTVDTMFYTEFKVPTCASYLYFTLSQFDLESLNKGASIPSLSTDILYNLKIVLPPQWLLTQFQQMIDVLNAQTEKLTQQNHNLTKQRDMLLPRLMSGKLEV
ncbi:MAG: restriction endonuclease subunit S [Akkermansia sp.]|nr:restriction endonuclease subunit S [Akkermansia sp.]